MKTFVLVLTATLLSVAAEPNTSKGLVFYDPNSRYGDAYVTSDWIRGMAPHDGSEGIVMFGNAAATSPEDYTAAPRGPLILSFVHPQIGKLATVNQVNFWIYHPLHTDRYPRQVPIKFLDAHGIIIATQGVAAVEFLISIRGIGPIASIEIGEFDYARDLMVSDIRFSRPRLIHDSSYLLTVPQQLRKATHEIDFETYPSGATPSGPVSDQWQSLGVVFSDENGNSVGLRTSPHLPSWSISDLERNRSGTNGIVSENQTLVITFVDPTTGNPGVVEEAGIWAVNMWAFGPGFPTTVQFIDAHGQSVETTISSGKFFFAGARSKKGIARIVLTDPDGFVADDLQFSPVRRVNPASLGDEGSRRASKSALGRFIF